MQSRVSCCEGCKQGGHKKILWTFSNCMYVYIAWGSLGALAVLRICGVSLSGAVTILGTHTEGANPPHSEIVKSKVSQATQSNGAETKNRMINAKNMERERERERERNQTSCLQTNKDQVIRQETRQCFAQLLGH